MTNSVTLASEHDSSDFTTYLERAQHLGCEHVWLIGAGKALAVYVGVFAPQGLLDQAPTVLGLRIFEREPDKALDTVAEIRAIRDRLAHNPLVIPLPVAQIGISWTGVAPPRTGWVPRTEISEELLAKTAESGIEEVAQANGLGNNIVQSVREEVWQRNIDGTDIPAGAAFAAFGLGFLKNSLGQVSSNGAWRRISTPRGHVLIKN